MNEQLSFFNAHFCYQGNSYQGNDDELMVQLDISGEDKILGIGFKSSNSKYQFELEVLKEKFLGKKIDEVSFGDLGLLSVPAFTFYMAIQDYVHSLHQNFQSYGGNPDQLICRCMRIDKDTLNKSIDEFEANKEKIVEKLMISQICGSCRLQFDKVLADSAWRRDYFADISNARWVENIKVALSRSGIQPRSGVQSKHVLPSMSYEVIRYQKNNVKLRASGDRGGLNRFELTEKIQDFLRDRIHPDIKVSVVL